MNRIWQSLELLDAAESRAPERMLVDRLAAHRLVEPRAEGILAEDADDERALGSREGLRAATRRNARS